MASIASPWVAAAAPAPDAAVPVAAGLGTSVAVDPAVDPLLVEVWTFGPGDHPFTRFGHNALRVVDKRTGADTAYNFGTFEFGSASMLGDFLKGRLRYWLSAAGTGAMAQAYYSENRTVAVQRLGLSAAQKRELARRLAVNLLPAHRDYRYDYFADNCSTRVRNAIDGVLGGTLRASARAPGTQTLRGHALRMTAEEPWLYVALLIVLGPSTDRPIDEWAEAFLPEKLQQSLRRFSLPDVGRDFVIAEYAPFRATRPPVRTEPPRWLLRFLAAGVTLGAALFALGIAASRGGASQVRRRAWPARISFGVLVVVLGLLLGFIGIFLAGAWMFTPHAVVYRNQNLLLFAPFALAFVILGCGVAAGRAGAMRKTFALAAAGTALCAFALVLKVFPSIVVARQDNAALIAALFPMWLGMTCGARALARSTRTGDARKSPVRPASRRSIKRPAGSSI